MFPQSYHFDSIPDNLKRRADAVIRSEQCLFEIIKPGNAVKKVKKAITLLNENSNSYRYLAVFYDNYSKVNYVRGTIYDEKGKIIRVLGILDVFDMSAITGSAFYSDDRMKVLYFPIYKFPYTIEYEYEVTYSSLINYLSWNFQDSPDVSVEKSGIQFIVPIAMKLRFYEENMKSRVDSVVMPDKKIYTWQEENLPASAHQQNYVQNVNNIPVLFTAPLEFEYAGFKGSMSSWKTFGDWIYSINKGRDDLPQDEINKMSEKTASAKDTRDKVRLIYEYVQSRTRYVSIQIGIGGLRPAEASAVSQNGFGDCKALVNYTMALLKAAGIKSYYTLVKAGTYRDINSRFVDNQFNHVILCVPMEQDSIWLDCTSQTLPFNYLGSFTSDRNVLLITPEGGKLVRTPGSAKNENVINRNGSVYLNILGASSGKISNYYSGHYFDIASGQFGLQSDEEMKQYLYSSLRFSDFNVPSVSYNENKSNHPSARFDYQISIKDFATANGSRIYFNPSISRENYLPEDSSVLQIVVSDIINDSVSYFIPLGYRVDYCPENVILENEFGKFRYQLEIKNDQVIYKRYLEMNKGKIPAEKYREFRSFINAIAKADRDKIILIKGT